MEFKFAARESSFRFVEFKFGFCGIQVCMERIKFAFQKNQFTPKESNLPFKRIKLHRMNQVFVTSCELRRMCFKRHFGFQDVSCLHLS